MSFCLVSFHAHPDDEALLTAGTLARAAAEGHRVVLVVATRGEAGLSDGDGLGDRAASLGDGANGDRAASLGDRRADELDRSATALGCAKVIRLDYPDSGMRNEHSGFASVPVEEAAERLAAILRAERADALTIYDRNGGYGHPDHVQVHRVGLRAAQLAGTRLVLEATVDRDALIRVLSLVAWTRLLPPDFSPARLRHSYRERAAITHRIDVRAFAAAKRQSMAAHASQAAGGTGTRTLALFLKLPRPLYRRVFGTEWFIEVGRTPARPPLPDLFASLR